MKLRTRLFLFVACTIVVMQVIYFTWTYFAVTAHVKSIRLELTQEIEEYNRNQVNDYLSFLLLSISEEELRINTLFDTIREYNWWKDRYRPSVYNFETNQWANSTMLVASHPWIDFVQSTVRDKLTSQIMMRPPYLQKLISVQLDEITTIIIEPRDSDLTNFYIGVPYWSNEIEQQLELSQSGILLSLQSNKNNWLLFSPEQLINMNPSELKQRNFQVPHAPLEPGLGIETDEMFEKLSDSTKAMILLVRNHLLKNPNVLDVLEDQKWLEKQLEEASNEDASNKKSPDTEISGGLETCQSHACKLLRSQPEDLTWMQAHDFKERDEQNHLLWQLGTITGSGLWYFDPLGRFAPIGIASFPRSDKSVKKSAHNSLGYGVLAGDVFQDKKLLIYSDCTPKPSTTGISTCITADFQIIRPPHDFSAIFLANTLSYESIDKETQKPAYGSLTIGVNISPILEKLALISPDRVLFLPKKGEPLMFDTHGKAVNLTISEKSILSHLAGKYEGTVVDTDLKEYYFLHVTNITNDDGQVFIIQFKDSVFRRVNDVKMQASKFLYDTLLQILVIGIFALILVVLVVNFYVNRLLRPIQDLVTMTDVVSTGDLDAVVIPEKDKIRKDEIGVLVNSFEQMVTHMKEGNQVRAVLNKVVNKEVADQIIKQGIELGGEVRQIAIMFADIREFTAISEHMKPQDVLGVLNDCLTVLSQKIDEHKGVIDKYVGDEIMAFFGAPIHMENPALQSILCSIAMMRALEEWNRFRASRGEVELKIGIGLHIGEVIAGNMGAENHLNYTILGHNVNLTSRLCDYAKEMEILITEEMLNAPGVAQAIEVEQMPDATFKGISEPVKIYKIKY